jgi:hypothetical protein
MTVGADGLALILDFEFAKFPERLGLVLMCFVHDTRDLKLIGIASTSVMPTRVGQCCAH